MQLVFIDDSARPDVPRRGLGSLHAYGAVIAPQDRVPLYAERLATLRKDLGVPADTEFKWNSGAGPLHKKWADQHAARTRMLQDAAQLGLQAVVVVCAPDRMPTGWDRDRIQQELLTYLYERVSMIVQAADDCAVLVADQPPGGRGDEQRWLRRALTLTRGGTEYVTADPRRFPLPILTARSDQVDLLQLADLVTASTTALIAGSRHAQPLRTDLMRIFARNAWGLIGGTGVKLVPDSQRRRACLLNLLHWVFGEDRYGKVSQGWAWMLPYREWDYATDDGLPA